ERCAVRNVGVAIIVVVRVAGVAQCIAVVIGLIGIRKTWAVVVRVENTVRVGVRPNFGDEGLSVARKDSIEGSICGREIDGLGFTCNVSVTGRIDRDRIAYVSPYQGWSSTAAKESRVN